MSRVITAAVLGLSVAFAAGAPAQQSHTTAAVTLHIISPSGEATLAIDRGDLTLAVADNEVRLVVKGDAHVRSAGASGAEVQMTNPTLVFSNAPTGTQSSVFQLSADRVMTPKPERH
jgi:hypothetical protein